MPRALDGDGEGALALRGQAGLAARFDLATLGKKPAQAGDILIVNLINTIGGENVYTTATATTTAKPAATAAEAATATATTEPTATAAAITPEAAATTVATTVIGTGGTVLTRRTVIRCPVRALLINHGLFLLKHAGYRA